MPNSIFQLGSLTIKEK